MDTGLLSMPEPFHIITPCFKVCGHLCGKFFTWGGGDTVEATVRSFLSFLFHLGLRVVSLGLRSCTLGPAY